MGLFSKLFKKKKQQEAGSNTGGIAGFIVDHNKGIRNIVIVFALFSAICYPLVGVNYDLTSYLPDTVPSKIAINKMKDVFGYPGTGRLMLKDVTIYEAKQYKSQVEKVEGVDQVLWCDTTTQVYGSSSFINYDDIDDYYKDGCAVMDITFTEGDTSKLTHSAINEIEKITGDQGALVGMSPTNKFIEENVKQQMTMIMGIAVVFIAIILLITTTSYFEPILFLTVIGTAIIINKGTNIIIGEISYITNNIADVMQLATSMDYSVFLLHAYERERHNYPGDNKTALKAALNTTISTVLSSSLTTFFGFVVLVTMNFKMGFDLGVVMSKSIICSLMMVIFFMPSLLLSWSDKIEHTRHRPFLPKFHRFSIVVGKISPFIVVISLLVAAPLYFAQGMNNFMYGSDATGAGPGTKMYEDSAEIDRIFGRSNLLVVIVPSDNPVKEKEMTDQLKDLPYVKSALGMAGTLPEGIPESIVPSSLTEMFHKEGYARLLVYIRTKPESPTAYKYTAEITDIINSYYPDQAYITGNTPTTEDMEKILIPDYNRVNTLAMISIFVVVAIAFKSVIMPIAAMIPIMMAIYVNMSFPYIEGKELIFIAYAVVSCIQLGSTIDYAILCTSNYLQIRGEEKDKRKAAALMIEMSFPSILTSGTILVVCGYAISMLSSIPAISEVGHLVGRGAILSMFFVVGMMPALLTLIDRMITQSFGQRRAHTRAAVVQTAIAARNRRRDRHEKVKEAIESVVSRVGHGDEAQKPELDVPDDIVDTTSDTEINEEPATKDIATETATKEPIKEETATEEDSSL